MSVEALPVPAQRPPLPAAWRMAVARCPYCLGLGTLDGGEAWPSSDEETVACMFCEGTGDLLGSMLRAAYKRGRESMLWRLGEVRNHVALAIEYGEELPVSTENLKRSVGL